MAGRFQVGFWLSLLLCGLGGWSGSCSGSQTNDPEIQGRQQADWVVAMEAVFAADSAMGARRNHAPETDSLAAAVETYVRDLETLDFSVCPPEFARAFAGHREAWRQSLPFWRRFPDLRGEMHDLIEEIRRQEPEQEAELDSVLKQIWDTWGEVEAAAQAYGVPSGA